MNRSILCVELAEVRGIDRLVLAAGFLRGAEVASCHDEVEEVLGFLGDLLLRRQLLLLFEVAVHAVAALKIAVHFIKVNLRIEFASV